ncbi:hypothetical protein R3P38DRAFT_2986778 [Favolaschia claudopus]|uniref:Secreted protein n=1 Tax=Favolaschia claudopus TaxID=2862362 RepID=A0AAW0AVH5_9AGAR
MTKGFFWQALRLIGTCYRRWDISGLFPLVCLSSSTVIHAQPTPSIPCYHLQHLVGKYAGTVASRASTLHHVWARQPLLSAHRTPFIPRPHLVSIIDSPPNATSNLI